jgi:hypothetical protein
MIFFERKINVKCSSSSSSSGSNETERKIHTYFAFSSKNFINLLNASVSRIKKYERKKKAKRIIIIIVIII